jgi:GNAT superfamily N-acetyltransferase
MELDRQAWPQLIAALGENTRTVIPLHFLKRPDARAWADAGMTNVVMTTGASKQMAFVFGDDAQWQTAVLSELPWMGMYWCPTETVETIFETVASMAPKQAILEPDVQRTVARHVHIPPPEGAEIRRLVHDDTPAIEACSEEIAWLCGAWERDWEMLLDGGILIGAIVDGRMVSGAVTYARAETLDDIGVATATDYQRRGLSSACASALVKAILDEGRQPVWTVFERNTPSVHISEKLGFVTQTKCVVIREKPEE